MEKPSFLWAFKMAFRDSRRSRGRLFLFAASIVAGIAALVAINSFSENLQSDLDRQARSLLGADLLLTDTQPIPDSILRYFDSLSTDRAEEIGFASMVYFPKNGGTRLVQIKALSGAYPFYGEMVTEPAAARQAFGTGQQALAEQTLLYQFGARPGDSVGVGRLNFLLSGSILEAPGQTNVAVTVAPVVMIPMQYLDSTGLLQRGSRVNYRYYFQLQTDLPTALADSLRKDLGRKGIGLETVESRKESVGRVFGNLSIFLNLTAFIALLLGCVGVASSVFIYIKGKVPTVAVLRCIGLTANEAFTVFLVQVTGMGLAGATIGAALGAALQYILPVVLGDFLPVAISLQVSWTAILQGILTGLIVSLLFGLLPLLQIRKVSPLKAIRADFEEETTEKTDWLGWLVYVLIGAFVWGFTLWQTRSAMLSAAFCAGVAVAFLLLAGVGWLTTFLARRYFPDGWSYLWRQSLANLYRPNNQTVLIIVAIGLGTCLLATMFFTRQLLLGEVALSSSDRQPNMVLFDVQPGQREGLRALMQQYQLPQTPEVPIITMRLAQINGRNWEQTEADSARKIPRWAFTREYRVTYRDSLTEAEEEAGGIWRGRYSGNPADTIYISVGDRFAESMGVKIGDRITFNVQGALIATTVGHLRKVDFNRVQANFVVLFPTGVLEDAPQFFVFTTRVPDQAVSAAFQQDLVQQFPNVSAIDIGLILKTLDDVLEKVSFVIQFMSVFSILTGLLVLGGSVTLSRLQRIQESVLLRTLGASQRQILLITLYEHLLLGAVSVLSGLLLAYLATGVLAITAFRIPYFPSPAWALLILPGMVAIIALIGLNGIRSILSRSPLEVLRAEA